MILTLTLNPAIDHNVTVDRLAFEDRAYILETSESAGGRGINASLVIRSFGGETLALAASGGKKAKRFEEYLAQHNVPFDLVRVKNELRTNLTITDQQGLTVKLNERGPEIDAAEQQRIEKAVCSRLNTATWLMICGSFPPGVPADYAKRLVATARKRGVKVLLDTDGDPLIQGLEAAPTVVAPNQQEAERLLSRALITRNHFTDAVERIKGMGAESVILSLGSRGAIGIDAAHRIVEAVPPRIEALCPIGAGDALAAASVWALSNGSEFADALRWGVAAGTASARLPGLSFATLDQTKAVYPLVELRSIR
ncbi:MAG TPA: 1-phosphofructokinase [Solibacterales bacterium]|nr:1-phosphofructokinase [Bryobacterales bacterium]